jgi:hypothetical protein
LGQQKLEPLMGIEPTTVAAIDLTDLFFISRAQAVNATMQVRLQSRDSWGRFYESGKAEIYGQN